MVPLCWRPSYDRRRSSSRARCPSTSKRLPTSSRLRVAAAWSRLRRTTPPTPSRAPSEGSSSGKKRASSGGNLSDLVAIHGEEMPGLKELEAGAERTDFRYAELPNGARIEYATMARPSSRPWTGGSRRSVPITGSTPHQTMGSTPHNIRKSAPCSGLRREFWGPFLARSTPI